jgi:hypothetical protein
MKPEQFLMLAIWTVFPTFCALEAGNKHNSLFFRILCGTSLAIALIGLSVWHANL